MKFPHMICVCPTYKRPEALANVVFCYEQQDYRGPANLIILDDAGQFNDDLKMTKNGLVWQVKTWPQRIVDLPQKFNKLIEMGKGNYLTESIVVIWEDDDIYMPWHLSSIAKAWEESGEGFLMPKKVFSDYAKPDGEWNVEDTGGRFHASWAFTYEAWKAVGGYPEVEIKNGKGRQLNYDQQMRERLKTQGVHHYSPTKGEASYVYRWGRFSYNGSQYPDHDVLWNRIEDYPAPWIGMLQPKQDEECRLLYERIPQ